MDSSLVKNDITITSGREVTAVLKDSPGVYSIYVSPDNNLTENNITLEILGSTLSTKYFNQAFADEQIELNYNPKEPTILSPEESHWIRGQYSNSPLMHNINLS